MEAANFKFKKNTSEAVISKASVLLSGLEEFCTTLNQKTLELEEGYNFLYLKAEMGAREFNRMLKAKFPHNYKDILDQLSIAELHSRFPQFHEKILTLGVSVCKLLLKASSELAVKALATTAKTVAEFKKIVAREKKGFALAPTEEQIQQLNVGTIVEITKKDPKIRGWLAEVTSTPDEFGQITVRVLKTMKPRQLFVDEVKPYSRHSEIDLELPVTDSDWESLKIQYELSESDFMEVKEQSYRHAQQDAPEYATKIELLWKHVIKTLDKYGLSQKFTSAAGLKDNSSLTEERTYTAADLQAAKEQAIADYQLKVEADWQERERSLLSRNQQLKEQLDSCEVERLTKELKQKEYLLNIAEKEVEAFAHENEQLKTELRQVKQSHKPVELKTELEAVALEAAVEEPAVEVTVKEPATEIAELAISVVAYASEVSVVEALTLVEQADAASSTEDVVESVALQAEQFRDRADELTYSSLLTYSPPKIL